MELTGRAYADLPVARLTWLLAIHSLDLSPGLSPGADPLRKRAAPASEMPHPQQMFTCAASSQLFQAACHKSLCPSVSEIDGSGAL